MYSALDFTPITRAQQKRAHKKNNKSCVQWWIQKVDDGWANKSVGGLE